MKRRMQSGNRPGNGPLMTDHLRDLDLELELLKRKRTMIEQQQRMLSDNRQQPYQQDFDQGYQRNYVNLYEDNHHRGQVAAPQFSQSYNSDAIWDRPGPAQPHYPGPQSAHYQFSDRNNDRFADKKKMRRPNPWANPMPLLNAPVSGPPFNQSGAKFPPKMARARPQPPKRKTDFKPLTSDKVVKHSTHSAINTLKNQRPQIRRDLVKNASGLVTPTSKHHANDIYLPEVKPSNQVLGRMEYCLGMVLKDIRANFSKTHTKFVNDPSHLRTIKQGIRERIQDVMLGKLVDSNQVVIDRYRAKYPISTDKEIVALCSDVETEQNHKSHVKPFLPEDDPEKFFKINFHKLFANQLDDMFAKITLLHKQQNKKSAEEIIKDLPDLTCEGKGYRTVLNEDTGSVPKNDDTSGTSENAAKEKVTLATPPTDQSTEAAETELTAEKDLEGEKESSEKTTDAVKTSVTEAEMPTQEASEVTITKNDKPSLNEDEQKKPKEKMSDTEKNKFYIDLLDQLIEQRLPHYFKNKMEDIIGIMNIDKSFKATRAAVILVTNKKAEKLARLPVPIEKHKKSKPEDKNNDSTEDKNEKTESTENPANIKKKPRLLFVKILARPNLPETNVMKAFLDGFNPKMIKKPRTVNNLLIVGLSDPKDYEKILAADGSTVGEKKLSICKSDSITLKERMKVNTIKNEKDENAILSDDLENQITDLLSTIRKAEEGNDEIEKATPAAEVKVETTIEETSANFEPKTSENGTDVVVEESKENEKVLEPEANQVTTTVSEQVNPAETVSEPANPAETVLEPANSTETVPELIFDKADNAEAKDETTAKTAQVENIQTQESVVPSTPTRSSGRITRSKLANQ